MRFKSAMGRGGVVEDIEVSHIQMTGIKHEAVILTMSYVLNLLNREQGAEGFSEDDIPYFKNITMHNINCMGAETAVKIEPMQGKPETISDITIRDSWFEAEKENVIDGVNIHLEA